LVAARVLSIVVRVFYMVSRWIFGCFGQLLGC